MKFVVMTGSLVLVEKILQAGLVPEIVVSYNPNYYKVSFTRNKFITKTLGYFKCLFVKLFKLPGYEIFWLCKKIGIKVWPEALVNHQSFADLLVKLDVDYAFVYSFRILMEKIFSIPKFGTINLHPSLLPLHKGATPLNWIIYQGDMETGFTIHYISKEIDGGDIIEQFHVPLSGFMTSETLTQDVTQIGSDLFVRFIIKLIHQGPPHKVINTKNQEGSYEKPFDYRVCEISSAYTLEKINRVIRSSGGKAFFVYNGIKYKVLYEVELENNPGLDTSPSMVEGNIYIKNIEGKDILLVVSKNIVVKKEVLAKRLRRSIRRLVNQ